MKECVIKINTNELDNQREANLLLCFMNLKYKNFPKIKDIVKIGRKPAIVMERFGASLAQHLRLIK